MKDSKIEWTDHTFNPWWGCVKVSPGCQHCYAETFAKRVGRDLWGPYAERRIASESYWRQPLKWNRDAIDAQTPPRVFCASMADVFEDRRDLDEHRERLWTLIERTPDLDWLLLTKRPQNISHLLPDRWPADRRDLGIFPENVWMMTTAEDQERLSNRMPYMQDLAAEVIGLSVEPMLGPVDLIIFQDSIKWVICGGESGPGARPMDVEWARDLRDQCASYGIPFFMKQLGSATMRAMGKTGKGDKIEDLPEDLRIREFPRAGQA